MEANSSSSQHTAFRLAEKHFKNRSQPGKRPSLRSPYPVTDLSRPEDVGEDKVWQAGWWSPINDSPHKWRKGKTRELGERPAQDLAGLRQISLGQGKAGWIVADGCILIPGYLTSSDQLDLVKEALSSYTRPPNPLSLSTHYDLPPNLFELYQDDSPDHISPLHAVKQSDEPSLSTASSDSAQSTSSARSTIETAPNTVVDFRDILAKNKTAHVDAPSDKLKPRTAGELMKEIRWANLGWVYQWSTKAYDFTPETPIPFPKGLRDVCANVVQRVPWSKVFEQEGSDDWSSWRQDYEPDTGIVNFYQTGDTLMGHVDRAELDPSRPLVSISLGHSCVFLLGSQSRDEPPRPIILRSGDVLVMSGRGRQFYHGVPRIMEGSLPDVFQAKDRDDTLTKAAKRWISTARININARQVFPPGFRRPS